MTREEIIAMFRADNPKITTRVISNTKLYNWCKLGDKEVAAQSRCIISDFTIASVASVTVYTARYDLSVAEPKFYAIDDYPGGGVSYADEPLERTSVAELDEEDSNWRSRSAGDPDKYYRRGKWLYFDRPIKTAGDVIRVYAALISDAFDDDSKSPFNSLAHLEPFHGAILKYLEWRTKQTVGKRQDAIKARAELDDYIGWMRKEISGGRVTPIHFRPAPNYYQPSS